MRARRAAPVGRVTRVLLILLTGALPALGLAGCGGAGARRPPRHRAGAEPAVAPPLARAPAGRVVTVGAGAEGIVADARARLIAVAVRRPARIALLDARTGAVIGHVPIGGPARHLQLDGSRLLVPEAPIDRLLELPLTGGAERPGGRAARAQTGGAGPPGSRSITTGSLPHDATAAAGRVFVADEFGRAVSVIAGDRELRRIVGFTQPGGIAAVGHDVALVDVGADTVTLIDGRTLRVLARAAAGSGPTHDVAGPDARLYVADTRGDALLEFATRPRLTLVDRVRVPGAPYGIASEAAHGRLWLTETARNRLLEYDVSGARPRLIAAYPTVRQPNTVAADPETGRVFVAGAAAGVVQEIHPRR